MRKQDWLPHPASCTGDPLLLWPSKVNMHHVWLVPVFALVVAAVDHPKNLEERCKPCDPSACRPPMDCLAGMVKDHCGCCFVCGRREGETCDNNTLSLPYKHRYGYCGEHLECRLRTDLLPSDPPEAVCVCIRGEPLCGSDGRTYMNECQLTEARYKRRDGLGATHTGPCKSVPTIVTPPEDIQNRTGGRVGLSCEVKGWPIPVIEWRVDRGDGDTVPLPSDDPKIAVQSRGGPSHYEVTGWLLLLDLEPKDEATYWCIAHNDEGEASASARIFVSDAPRDQSSVDNNHL